MRHPSRSAAMPLGRQLLEMRAHVFASRRHQPRLETIIDGFGDRLHGPVARRERRDNLPLPLAPMLEVRNAPASADRRSPGRAPASSWRGSSSSTRSSDARYCRQVAAAARLDHHAAAGDDEVAGEERARRLVPEREVIWRVAGRMDDGQRVVAAAGSRRRRSSASPATPAAARRSGHGYFANAAPGCAAAIAGTPVA